MPVQEPEKHFLVLLNRSRHRKLALNPPSACPPKRGPHRVIGQQVTYGFGQAHHILEGNQPTGFARFDHL